MTMGEDYILNQKEAIERVREIDKMVIEELNKDKKDREKITRLRFEQMLRGLYITQNPIESGRFY